MALRYGAIIMIAMNELVFPSICEDCNSFEDVLLWLVPCDSLADAVEGAIGLPGALTEGLCGTALSFGAQYVEGMVLDLELAGNPEVVGKEEAGVTGGGMFYLVDTNMDLTTEDVTEFEMHVQWNDPNDPVLSQDILLPITGEGRAAASGCTHDAICDAGETCQPVAHYLKIAELEMDCRIAVGAATAGASCTQDVQCGSGLCVGATQNTAGACFAACEETSQCGAGTCVSDGVLVNLDDVMNGLGDVATNACMQ
jgi:hypothetical protein